MSEVSHASNWNVISEGEFKEYVKDVFEKVSIALKHTFGPYGSTSIIEQYGEMCFTKDGWMLLKNLKFDDPISNNILMLLLRISAQVVIKVGDGSTSSIIASQAILNELENSGNLNKKIRPKEFIDLFKECVDIVVKKIYENATKIDTDYDAIYKLAHVSTNGDDKIASIIKEIYEKTNNPSIEYSTSKTNDTYFEVIDGYKANITYLDNIFATHDDGTCRLKNPNIIMFDYKIDTEQALNLIGLAASNAAQNNRRLVVVAPHYDRSLLEYIRKNINIEYKARGTTTVVYTRVSLTNNISHELFNDFAIMCGAQVISEQFVDDITEDTLSDYVGSVDEMSIGDKTSFISGFSNRNQHMYEKAIEDATNKYRKQFEENRSRGIVDIHLNEYKQRLTKLHGKMGAIYVGGGSELEKTANNFLVEDAVKACESAYEFGYNCGGNLIIPRIIDQICDDNSSYTIGQMEMFNMIRKAFIEVYRTLLSNKYTDDPDTVNDIIDTIMNSNIDECYDLVNDTISKDIINSCETDIEILKATASIISLLISSNQYVTIAPQK